MQGVLIACKKVEHVFNKYKNIERGVIEGCVFSRKSSTFTVKRFNIGDQNNNNIRYAEATVLVVD